VKFFRIDACERSKPLAKSSAAAAIETIAVTDVRVAMTEAAIDRVAMIARLAAPMPLRPKPRQLLPPKELKPNVNAQAS
jgi:hypothetical protein